MSDYQLMQERFKALMKGCEQFNAVGIHNLLWQLVFNKAHVPDGKTALHPANDLQSVGVVKLNEGGYIPTSCACEDYAKVKAMCQYLNAEYFNLTKAQYQHIISSSL